MRKLLITVIAVLALGGCGKAASTSLPSLTTETVPLTTPSIPATTPTTSQTNTTGQEDFDETQLAQLESSVNNAQSLLDQTDQLTADN